jgi:EAL domain-containing protein (putative c-di-GMP-specific phosphodiesterase class I)
MKKFIPIIRQRVQKMLQWPVLAVLGLICLTCGMFAFLHSLEQEQAQTERSTIQQAFRGQIDQALLAVFDDLDRHARWQVAPCSAAERKSLADIKMKHGMVASLSRLGLGLIARCQTPDTDVVLNSDNPSPLSSDQKTVVFPVTFGLDQQAGLMVVQTYSQDKRYGILLTEKDLSSLLQWISSDSEASVLLGNVSGPAGQQTLPLQSIPASVQLDFQVSGNTQVFLVSKVALVVFLIMAISFVWLLAQRSVPKAGKKPVFQKSDLQKGLIQKAFLPHYQPIFDLSTGQVRGCEVLVRWEHEEGMLALPDMFMQLMKQSDLLNPMMLSVVRQAGEQLKSILQTHPDFELHINLDMEQLGDDDFLQQLDRYLNNASFSPQHVVFDIALGQGQSLSTPFLSTLKEAQTKKYRLCFDDKIDEKALALMEQFTFDMIKLDRDLIQNLGHDHHADQLMASLILLSRASSIQLLAAGLETRKQADTLKKLGITAAQGHLFAPALNSDAMGALIQGMQGDTHAAKSEIEEEERLEEAA